MSESLRDITRMQNEWKRRQHLTYKWIEKLKRDKFYALEFSFPFEFKIFRKIKWIEMNLS